MKYTLLDMTQVILSAMDSDEVNSIRDTVEAQQVAHVIRECYNDIAARAELPEQHTLFELEPSLDATKPTVMYLPNDVVSLEWVRYDRRTEEDGAKKWTDVKYLPMDDFFSVVMSYEPTDTRVGTMVVEGNIQVQYLKDTPPTYYTSYNDRTILFDAFDWNDGSTLRKDKTLCYGEKDGTFLLEDNYVPNLDAKQFRLLLNEAKALAFAELKQTQHAKAERKAQQGWLNLQRTKDAVKRVSALSQVRGYGRK